MKEHGILMSAPMVKAILAGRKSVTRRIVKVGKLLPDSMQRSPSAGAWWSDPGGWIECPYGRVGDRLWVREAWKYPGSCWSSEQPNVIAHSIVYAADGARRIIVRPHDVNAPQKDGIPAHICRCSGKGDEFERYHDHAEELTRYWARSWPSIFMPRWASRITLTVTDVRVERLQEISEEDARAEGCEAWVSGHGPVGYQPERTEYHGLASFRHGYEMLWQDINGERAPWSSNPWVWVIAFRRVEAQPSQGGE